MEGQQPADVGSDRWCARADARASPCAGFRPDERDALRRPEVFERRDLYELDPRHRSVEYDVRAADFLRKDHAVLVVSRDAWAVTIVALGLEEIVGCDQANAGARRRIPCIGDRVKLLRVEVSDARVLYSPLLIGSFARYGGLIPDLLDLFSVRGEREGETGALRLFLENTNEEHHPSVGAIDGCAGIEAPRCSGERYLRRANNRIGGESLEWRNHDLFSSNTIERINGSVATASGCISARSACPVTGSTHLPSRPIRHESHLRFVPSRAHPRRDVF